MVAVVVAAAAQTSGIIVRLGASGQAKRFYAQSCKEKIM